jgi:MarR family transcriptional regulator, transcriptional regulator for hemolysin
MPLGASRDSAGNARVAVAKIITLLIFSYVMEKLERDPIVVLSVVARLIRTRADARARTYGMTRAQWMILVHLERQPGMSQNELAAHIEVEPITIGRLVDRLEARGFLERRPDAADRRVWRLHLTAAAEPMLKEIDHARAELNEMLIANVPKKSLEAAIDCLLQMKANLTAEPRVNAKSA